MRPAANILITLFNMAAAPLKHTPFSHPPTASFVHSTNYIFTYFDLV